MKVSIMNSDRLGQKFKPVSGLIHAINVSDLRADTVTGPAMERFELASSYVSGARFPNFLIIDTETQQSFAQKAVNGIEFYYHGLPTVGSDVKTVTLAPQSIRSIFQYIELLTAGLNLYRMRLPRDLMETAPFQPLEANILPIVWDYATTEQYITRGRIERRPWPVEGNVLILAPRSSDADVPRSEEEITARNTFGDNLLFMEHGTLVHRVQAVGYTRQTIEQVSKNTPLFAADDGDGLPGYDGKGRTFTVKAFPDHFPDVTRRPYPQDEPLLGGLRGSEL